MCLHNYPDSKASHPAVLRFMVNPATLAGLKVKLVTFSCPVPSLAWVVSGSHAGGPAGYRHGGSWIDSSYILVVTSVQVTLEFL